MYLIQPASPQVLSSSISMEKNKVVTSLEIREMYFMQADEPTIILPNSPLTAVKLGNLDTSPRTHFHRHYLLMNCRVVNNQKRDFRS